ncbi:threonine synthase [Microlunatus soli]|uniref:Threonine synthase n=1 Tax=Microlunatus soli TaxID=630515 RepID=A0A1H1ZT81_9ACTN|nr:threonine synthase [Microlunatus soli]SDT36860.1 threonine synthase [Microlunatus soli]
MSAVSPTDHRVEGPSGVIERYREWLPIGADDPYVALGEGSTPLVRANALSEKLGSEIWLKVEGANPTGSFKDRGMAVAVSKALAEGATAVICASTGNTSASAAAYASRAGLQPIVLLPAGRIAAGKLAQAVIHGARIVQLDGNFDACLDLARQLADNYPVSLVNSVNPVRLEGQKTAAFEIVDALGDAPDVHVLPVGNGGNISAYWLGFTQYADHGNASRRPQVWGFQAAGAAPLVNGAPVADPDTIATAIRIGRPASTELAIAAKNESGGFFAAVDDDEIMAAQTFLARKEGIFVEPASAAGVAGLLAMAERGEETGGRRITVTVTGHGLKDIDTALGALDPIETDVVQADLPAVAAACGL